MLRCGYVQQDGLTIPPVEAVGLTESQAQEKGLKFRVKSQKASDWFTARQSAEPV
jgi:glutathione reductase (NADPH)